MYNCKYHRILEVVFTICTFSIFSINEWKLEIGLSDTKIYITYFMVVEPYLILSFYCKFHKSNLKIVTFNFSLKYI